MSVKDSATAALRVDGLCVDVATPDGWATVVEDVSLAVDVGEIHGLVGESGSGKSLTAMAIMGLISHFQSARVTGGQVLLGDVDLLALSNRELRRRQGKDLAMVFQEPMTSLNPAFTVADQIGESIRSHLGASRKEARERSIELLEEVGIADARRRCNDYPHQFSGGMRQRVMLAVALACEPRLLIADEPTTALDVTVQAQMLELIRSLVERHGMAVIFITHDLGVIAEICDRATVLYAGQVIESGLVGEVIKGPRHPYTEGLLRSVPADDDLPLWWIDGSPPLPGRLPSGCRFSPRCEYSKDKCVTDAIPLLLDANGRAIRCARADELSLDGRD
jgi:peptide/nickel transport system ATP-binding protein